MPLFLHVYHFSVRSLKCLNLLSMTVTLSAMSRYIKCLLKSHSNLPHFFPLKMSFRPLVNINGTFNYCMWTEFSLFATHSLIQMSMIWSSLSCTPFLLYPPYLINHTSFLCYQRASHTSCFLVHIKHLTQLSLYICITFCGDGRHHSFLLA